MKRLVYSPKVYAYVSTEKNGVVNLTDYIVKGSVTRVVNAASSAELNLRNPHMIWTKGATSGDPVFRPMDPITIWLQRIQGFPVQAFTGYLDRTPYKQLYPGTCRITASCTLKRLLYTFWDPALSFTNTFLQEYGWVSDRKSGQLIKQSGEKSLKRDNPVLNDGSIGELLFAVLKHVVEWDPKGIRIEKIPPDVISKVQAIYDAYADDAKQVDKNIQKFLKAYVGEGTYGDTGGGGGGGNTGGDGASGEVKGMSKITQTIEEISNKHNIPSEMTMAVCDIETRYGSNMHRPGAPYWGWFQINTNGSRYSPPTPKSKLLDLGYSCTLFCKGAAKERQKNLLQWAMVTQGVNCSNNPLYCSEWNGAIARAKGYLSKYGGKRASSSNSPDKIETGGKLKTNSDSGLAHSSKKSSKKSSEKYTYPLGRKGKIIATVANHKSRAFGNWMSDDALDISTVWREKTIACEDGAVDRVSGSWGGIGTNPNGFTVYLTGKSGNQYSYMHHIEIKVKDGQKVKAGDILGYAGGANNVKHLHFAVKPPVDPMDIVGGETVEGGGSDAGGGGGGGDSGGPSYDSVLSTSKAAAFSTQMQFEGVTEAAEAQALGGQRSLMNDKPIFPFIEQLSNAALRSFQSLPNGDFYAFYPDYFGNMRDSSAYWNIYDIEILDGAIDLSDEALATHVFTIGDTMPYTPGIQEFERMRSTGTVSIYNVAQSGFVNAEQGNTKKDEASRQEQVGKVISDPGRVTDFLTRYGARPHLDEAPMIRNQFFEAFRGWHVFQLLWSRQFLTEFTFTFMPEIFPGGLVGFPEHGIQCYVDEVTHTFDYETGFQTAASLSAPSTLTDSKINDDPLQFGMVKASGK